METNKCINEWNATIEALGQGKQTILIRKYRTLQKYFLFHPTVSYAAKDDYLQSFQKNIGNLLKTMLFQKRMGKKQRSNTTLKLMKLLKNPVIV